MNRRKTNCTEAAAMIPTDSLALETIERLMKKRYTLVSIDYYDHLLENLHVIQQCIQTRSAGSLIERYGDRFADMKYDAIREICKELKSQCEDAGYSVEDIEMFFDEYEFEINGMIFERDDSNPLRDLLKNTGKVKVRIEMHSNYDCINSHRFDSSGGYAYEESYFGAMVDALNLKVKKLLLSHGIKTSGSFPSKAYRNGKEWVSYDAFFQELENSCCGANLLVFVGRISALELYDRDFKVNRITIPKGNCCGLFSSCYGGGSLIEMILRQDVILQLNAGQYDYCTMELEYLRRDGSYSIDETYGVTNKFWGKTITVAA